MSIWHRAPEIRFLQEQGKLNSTLDPWSDSESDAESFTEDNKEKESSKAEKTEKMNEKPQKMWIRPYEEKDREAVAEVCVLTAGESIRYVRSPKPTEAGEVEPELLVPHMWCYSYLTLSPSYCFVLVAQDDVDLKIKRQTTMLDGKEDPQGGSAEDKRSKVVGYILCAPDTLKYVKRIDEEYVPSQATTRPWLNKDWRPEGEMDEKRRKMLTMLHYPGDALVTHRYPDIVSQYPAHLHINILPGYVGGGWGRKLQETLWTKLRAENVPGLHLECAEDNYNAQQFYEHLGFEPWKEFETDGRKGVFRDKIARETMEIMNMCMVKKL